MQHPNVSQFATQNAIMQQRTSQMKQNLVSMQQQMQQRTLKQSPVGINQSYSSPRTGDIFDMIVQGKLRSSFLIDFSELPVSNGRPQL